MDPEFVYLFITGADWEYCKIILSKEEAIQVSIDYPHYRVEIFSKDPDLGYSPTYNYYKNGELCNFH